MSEAKYLTASDAALVLQVTPGAVRMMLKRGELPVAERTEGGIRLFLRADVDRLASVRRERQAQAVRRASGAR